MALKKAAGRKIGKSAGYERICMIVWTVFLSFFPFITRLVVNQVPEIEERYFATTDGYIADLMLYCKEIALAVFVGAVLLHFLGSRIFPDKIDIIDRARLRRLRLPLICMGGYVFFSVLSFILSDYKATAFLGVNSEYEGLLAILCYAGLFLFGVYYLKRREAKYFDPLKIFIRGMIILCFAVGVLSLVEIYYKPILEIGFVQVLISPEKYRELARNIKNENFIGQISLTFNNPGFLGGFCALFIPFCFCVLQFERKAWRVITALAAGMLGLAAVWSNSRVALVSLAITIPLCVILLIRTGRTHAAGQSTYNTYRRNIFVNLIIVSVTAVSLTVLSYILPTYSSRVRSGQDSVTAAQTDGNAENGIYRLTKAELKDGELFLYSDDCLLKISMDQNVFDSLYDDYYENDFSECLRFSDGERPVEGKHPATLKATSIRDEIEGFSLDDQRYSAVKMAAEQELLVLDLGYPGSIEFYLTSEGIRLFGQGSNLLSEIPQPRVQGFESIYSFGTGRGYLWTQSLPLLGESLLFGSGNGTFAFRIRQNEIVGLLNTHGSCKYVIDRPHNWYLQIACSDGVTASICVLLLFAFYIIMYLKAVFRKNNGSVPGSYRANAAVVSPEERLSEWCMQNGIFAGLLGFMLCGLINDSCITVNPLFWVLLGCAVGRLADMKSGSEQ